MAKFSAEIWRPEGHLSPAACWGLAFIFNEAFEDESTAVDKFSQLLLLFNFAAVCQDDKTAKGNDFSETFLFV